MRRGPLGPGTSPRLVMAVVAAFGVAAVGGVLLRRAAPGPEAAPAGTSTSIASSGAVSTSTSARSTTRTGEAVSSPFESDGVYRWLWVEPDAIRFVWRNDDGVPHGQLQFGREALEADGEQVVAITNGGIHRPDLVPSGLYVENGVELTPLNRATGSGNFFLEPNGVFWIEDGKAGVETTDAYAARDRTVDGAVQSGPMLVVDSAVNPAFSETSTSTHRRNAVGVDENGRVLLIVADRAVTLWAMADRCRQLGAVDALYLDGTLSRLDAVNDGRTIFPNLPVASMIAVVEV